MSAEENGVARTSGEVACVNMRDLARNLSEVMGRVEHEGDCFLVTRRGVPIATVTPIDPEALEDFVLANATQFVRSRREADSELAQGKTRSLGSFLEELRIPGTATQRKRTRTGAARSSSVGDRQATTS